MATVYILYSQELNRYYTGYTTLTIEERLMKHMADHKGFTSKAKDWEIIMTISCENRELAIKKENQIKKRGAKRFLDGYRSG